MRVLALFLNFATHSPQPIPAHQGHHQTRSREGPPVEGASLPSPLTHPIEQVSTGEGDEAIRTGDPGCPHITRLPSFHGRNCCAVTAGTRPSGCGAKTPLPYRLICSRRPALGGRHTDPRAQPRRWTRPSRQAPALQLPEKWCDSLEPEVLLGCPRQTKKKEVCLCPLDPDTVLSHPA